MSIDVEALNADELAKLRLSVEMIAKEEAETGADEWTLHWSNGVLVRMFATLDAITGSCATCGQPWPCTEVRQAGLPSARLVPAEDEGRPDLASEYGRLLAWRDRLVAEGADPADLEMPERPLSVGPRPAEDEGRLREALANAEWRAKDYNDLATAYNILADAVRAAIREPWTDPKG